MHLTLDSNVFDVNQTQVCFCNKLMLIYLNYLLHYITSYATLKETIMDLTMTLVLGTFVVMLAVGSVAIYTAMRKK